ncbi:MAG: DUF3098 domain-containing protein [Chitinophagaceae bacterium]
MAVKKNITDKAQPTLIQETAMPTLFSKQNYTWMAIGAAIILLGMVLMAGGKSQDPHVFNTNEIYSTVRITIAPILIVGGLLIEIYAIFKKSVPAES